MTTEWRRLSKPESDELPPLIFQCRWRYNAGQYCGVHIERDERLCGKHQTEDVERLRALREARMADAPAQ